MRIHVVCYDDLDTWILGKIARRMHRDLLALGLDATLGNQPDPSVDVNHHIIYDDYRDRTGPVETVMITHIVNDGELSMVRRQLIDCGVEMGICMSRATVTQLAEAGVPRYKLCFIGPAHDATMKPRRTLIGLTTRLYPDGRKREHLLTELASAISPDDFRFAIMGSGWDAIVETLRGRGFEIQYIDRFDEPAYRELMPTLDYYLYTGLDEGSLGFLDALSAGVPTIVTPQGFHLDVPGGITHAFTDIGDLQKVFADIAAAKNKRAESVSLLTWPENARKHVRVWDYLLSIRAGREIPTALASELEDLGVQFSSE